MDKPILLVVSSNIMHFTWEADIQCGDPPTDLPCALSASNSWLWKSGIVFWFKWIASEGKGGWMDGWMREWRCGD